MIDRMERTTDPQRPSNQRLVRETLVIGLGADADGDPLGGKAVCPPVPAGFPTELRLPPGLAPVYVEHRDVLHDEHGDEAPVTVARTWLLRQPVQGGIAVASWLSRQLLDLGWAGRVSCSDGLDTGDFEGAGVSVRYSVRRTSPRQHVLALRVRHELAA